MNQETFDRIMNQIILPLATVIIPLLTAFISLKGKEILDRIHDAKLKKYVAIAEDAIETAVVAIMQTYVDAIKNSGTWDEIAQKKAFNDAKLKAITIMGTKAKEAIAAAYGDVNEWIDNSIEYYVNKNKSTALQPLITEKPG